MRLVNPPVTGGPRGPYGLPPHFNYPHVPRNLPLYPYAAINNPIYQIHMGPYYMPGLLFDPENPVVSMRESLRP